MKTGSQTVFQSILFKDPPSQRHPTGLLGYEEKTYRIPALKGQVGKDDEQSVLALWDVGCLRGIPWHSGK